MEWNNIKRKLTSRKFWAAIVSFVTMLIVALGVAEETAAQVASIIMAGATVIAYIIGEGMVDANSGTITITEPDQEADQDEEG